MMDLQPPSPIPLPLIADSQPPAFITDEYRQSPAVRTVTTAVILVGLSFLYAICIIPFIYIDHTYKRLVSRQPPKGSKNSEILGRLMRGEFVFKEVTGNIEGLMNGDSENVDVKKGGNRGDKEIQV